MLTFWGLFFSPFSIYTSFVNFARFIGEMVVLGLVVVVTALGTVAALWGSTKLVLL